MGVLALIGLGSNLGDRRANLDAAVAALAEAPGVSVRAVSRYYATDPVGGPSGQGAFLNAAAALETTRDAPALLHLLHQVEARLGRVRSGRWGERTLDLDLLLHGETRIENEELIVPHPRMALRRFVLVPLAEIAPDAIDPFTGHTVAGLLANLDRRPGYIALSNHLPFDPAPIFARLVQSLGAVGFIYHPLERAFDEQFDLDEEDHLEPYRRMEFEQLVRELHASRWSSETWGDRWIITDFYLDDTVSYLHQIQAEERPGDYVYQFTKGCLQAAIAPTFVVTAWGEACFHWMHDTTYRGMMIGRPREAPPALRVFPRSGLPDHPEWPPNFLGSAEARQAYRRAYDTFEGAWRDAIVSEVLAACAASRARVEPA